MEVLRVPRVGGISISSTTDGILKPSMTDFTARLDSEINRNSHRTSGGVRCARHWPTLAIFSGERIRSAQSVLGLGDEEMINVNASLLTHEDHDADIKFEITNFGHNPYTVKQEGYIGQLIMLGVDEVILDFIPFEDEAHDFMGSTDADDGEIIHRASLGEVENALAAPAIAPKKPWEEYQKQGGPETAKLYDPDAPIPELSGVLRPFASRILMGILYAARICRCDLLRAVCGLASCATKWTHQCDRDLRRLTCYINATKDHAMIGWCGDPSSALELRVYADADFTGCVRTMRSTTGVILAVSGPNARVILAGVSKRQTAVSHSTPEAEIIAAVHAMRAEGIPALSLLETIFEREVSLAHDGGQ
jgi:hypothetical protein